MQRTHSTTIPAPSESVSFLNSSIEVSIDEPTVEQTVEILGVLSERYAEHHEVRELTTFRDRFKF